MEITSDLSVIILATDGVNRLDLAGTRDALERAGVKVVVASNKSIEVKAWERNNWSNRIRVDSDVKSVGIDDYQGLIIPGGAFHSDELRLNADSTKIVREFFAAGKTIGAIGQGVQLLIEAETIKGRKVTGPISLKTDIGLAGGVWDTENVCADNGLITCPSEKSLDEFNKLFLERLREGVAQRSETII